MTRLLLLAGSALLVLACDRGRDHVSGGDVLSDSVAYEALDYTLTSDNYNKWLRAQHALDSAAVEAPARLDIRHVSENDLERVTEALERQPQARAAIESADMSVKDFVLTTVALAQSWDAVNGPAARVIGARPENLDFLRERSRTDAAVQTRPTGGIVGDDDSDDVRDSDRDSDSDSEGRGRGKGRGKGKGKGRGRG